MTSDPTARPFPVEAMIVFPLVGPPAIAFAMAMGYAAVLMASLSFNGILAIPVYGVFWTVLLAPILAPPLALGGLLYAAAVRRFAAPRLTTALVAAAVSGAACTAAVALAWRFAGLDLGRLHLDPNDILPVALGCIVGVVPGWWVTRAIRRWRGAE